MQRLTTRPQASLIKCAFCNEEDKCYGNECGEIDKAIQRLKEYEDAEEQGLLIRLPCKVGDTAYYVHKRGIDEVEVDSFVVNVNIFVNVSLYVGGERFGKTLTPYKTLFFTKKRSRKALEGMG